MTVNADSRPKETNEEMNEVEQSLINKDYHSIVNRRSEETSQRSYPYTRALCLESVSPKYEQN